MAIYAVVCNLIATHQVGRRFRAASRWFAGRMDYSVSMSETTFWKLGKGEWYRNGHMVEFGI